LSLVLSLLIVFSLTACGGGDGGSGGKKDSGLPGIDMKSTEVQTVSADRATLDVLNETFFTYLGGLNYFSDDDEQSKLTYADLKEHIGVDCSDYCYDEAYQRGIYTWYADEDDAWVGGIFYYNPTDKRFLVAKRIGLGSTVNLGTWAGKLYYAFVGLVLVVCLAIGPIFGIVDSIPVRLELSGSAPVCLVASHGQSEKYRLDTDAITDVQLRDTLPDATRTWGTGMDHYLQGDFYVIGEGNARFCLDPTQKCFLRVEAGGQVYWFTGDSEDHTAAIAQALQSTVHP